MKLVKLKKLKSYKDKSIRAVVDSEDVVQGFLGTCADMLEAGMITQVIVGPVTEWAYVSLPELRILVCDTKEFLLRCMETDYRLSISRRA